jgi:hypothetical protein
MSGITRQLAAAAPAAEVRVIDVPPVAGAALLGLDHVRAPAAAAARLRAAYGIARLLPARLPIRVRHQWRSPTGSGRSGTP